MRPYIQSTQFSGSPEAAVKVVRDALIANEFTIVEARPTAFTATGPGTTSSNQNAIRGVSKVTFRADSGLLHVQAELGGVARLGYFAIFFPIGLGLFLAAIFWILGSSGGFSGKRSIAVIVPLLAVSPWLVLGPVMACWMRKRTERAIDSLLQSAASISRVV